VPQDLKKVTKAVAKSRIAAAEKESAKEFEELNQEAGVSLEENFNAKIVITEYFKLESDGSENELNHEL